MKLRLKKRVIIPLAIAAAALIAIPFLLRKNSSTSSVQYQTETVASGTLTTTISGSGNLYVDSTSTISPTISGTVRNLKVAVGDKVKKGQTLFYIDDDGALDLTVTKAATSVTQAEQSVSSAQTQVLQAQSDLADANTRNTDHPGTVTDLDLAVLTQKVSSAQLAVTVAQNNLTAAKSDLATAKTNAAKRTVTAPIDGTITTLNVANGDTVGSGSSSSSSSSAGGSTSSSSSSSSSAALVIDNLNTLKAKVSLNEVDAINAAAGQAASLTFDAIDGLTLTGKVESVGVTGTVSNGVVTYEAVIALDAQNEKLRPQMTTTATITTNVRQNVISVPTTAIKTNSSDVSYVQVMENGTPRQQEVTLGISDDSNTEITAGLSVGQTIVTSTTTTSSTTSNSSSSNSSSTRRDSGPTGIGGMGGIF